ncbi:MAG TPA: hypothetical protein VMJ66_04105 [Geobacteraceae bacterium]|nr:hypothetical protein [Geobacteraceae bacterium]
MATPDVSSPGRASGGWLMAATLLLTVVILWRGTGEAAQNPRFIDYLCIEANEGDSSGGHAAIRFGNEIFHFQNEPPGILRIRRHDAAAFHHVYAMLGNRAIRELRIAVADDTYAMLRDAFARLLVVQDAQLDIRDALAADTALFAEIFRQRSDPHGPPHDFTLSLSGFGYFLPDAPGTAAGNIGEPASSPALVALRSRIGAVYGARFTAERIDRAEAGLRGMELRAAGLPLPEIGRDAFPLFEPSTAARYRDNLRAIQALKLLQAAPRLRPGTFLTTDDDAFRLGPAETAILKRFASQLESDLVRLADSPRSDWGLPFVLGMARLAAMEESIRSGRLVLLDIYPRGNDRPAGRDNGLAPYLPQMEREMRAVYLQKRREFFAAVSFREAGYAAMERSGNLLLAIDRAIKKRIPFTEEPENTFPAREAWIMAPLPVMPDEALAGELAAARAAELEYSTALQRLYGYNLVRRNCVTEIFAVINRAMAPHVPASERAGKLPETDATAALHGESAKRLGGFLDPAQGLLFIPFVSAMDVKNNYTVVAEGEFPSFRSARLAEMYEREAPLKVFLRESNTITSTVYHPLPDDSAFLFFTDNAVPLRPLFGAFNLLAGFADGMLGVLTMPVEGPGRLLAGTKGVLYSLPELVFVNLRKGSMVYVERSATEMRDPPVHPGKDQQAF